MVKIFVASASAAESQAKEFIKGCANPEVTFVPWWDEITAGKTLLEELARIRKNVDCSVVILTPESTSTLRGLQQPIPNLNVLFEFGFFFGALGGERVAVVRYGEVYLPSDLGGYVHIIGSKHFARSGATKVGKRTKLDFERWFKAAAPPQLTGAKQARDLGNPDDALDRLKDTLDATDRIQARKRAY